MNLFTMYNLVYLITNILTAESIREFMGIFFEERKKLFSISLCTYIIYYVLSSVAYLFINIPLVNMVVCLTTLFIITFNYDADIKKRLLSSLYILMFLVGTEILIGACTNYFKFSFFTKGSYTNIFGLVITRLMIYLESIVFQELKSIRRNQFIPAKLWLSFIFIPISAIFLRMYISESEILTKTNAVLTISMILLMNFAAFYSYDVITGKYQKILETESAEAESRMYREQCLLMQKTTEELSFFRHDIKNQFEIIKELVDKGEYQKLKGMLSVLSSQVENNVIFCNTQNFAIDSIVNYKLRNINQKRIKAEKEIAIPRDLDLEISDMSSLLGNLLDNALQALEEVEDEKYLFVKIVYSMDNLIIRIQNNFTHQIKYVNGKIVTTKCDKENHGIGLNSVKKIVDKYQGYMKIDHRSSYFTVDIILYI